MVARSQDARRRRALRRDTLVMALTAALPIGAALTFLQQAARYVPDHRDRRSASGSLQTATTVVVLGVLAAARRAGGPPPAARLGLAVATLGVLDVGANVLFATASTRENPAAVAVLGSLYPVDDGDAGPHAAGRAAQPLADRRGGRAMVGVALIALGS